MLKSTVYRAEIDGLRAVAVIPVVLFHAGVPGFPGGFVGVDVFFVISGYLITSIILRDLDEGSFSFKEFYLRRARRILPALYFVILCTIPFAGTMMMPSELKAFSQSIIFVAMCVANYFFYLKSDYFAPASELSPLLHTWSLAVEEQFYFVFPVLLYFLHRLSHKFIVAVLILVGAVSLVYSQFLLGDDVNKAYYFAFGRAWELLSGSVLVFAPRFEKIQDFYPRFASLLRRWVPFVGLGMILASICLLDKRTPFPGLWAVPTVFGSMLIIYFANNDTGIGRFLSTSPLVSIGLISYSLYLWHQPVFAVSRIVVRTEPSVSMFVGSLSFIVVAAYLSWRFVERPFRKNSVGLKTRLVVSSMTVGFVCVFAIAGIGSSGFRELKYRFAGEVFRNFEERLAQLKAERTELWSKVLPEGSSAFTGSTTRRVLVVGDSRGEDLFVSLWLNRLLFEDTEFRYQRLDDLCFSALSDSENSQSSVCGKEVNNFVFRLKNERPDLILLCCGWQQGSLDGVRDFLNYVEGIPVIVFGSASFTDISSQYYTLSRHNKPREKWAEFFTLNQHIASQNASERIRGAIEGFHSVAFVDVRNVFAESSKSDEASVLFDLADRDGDPLLIDQTHLTVDAAKKVGKFIFGEGWLESIRLQK